jgi:hypothetical protein
VGLAILPAAAFQAAFLTVSAGWKFGGNLARLTI